MLDRPPNSPRARAKPSCDSPRRVRKRSNNCDCYSEKRVVRASGKAFALPGYGGLRRSGRTAVQDSLRLKKPALHSRNRSFFSGRKLGLYQHFARRSIYSPMGIHRLFSFERELDGNAPISVRVIVRYHSPSQFTIDTRLHGTRTDHFFGPEARTISTIGHRTLNF